MSGLGSRLERTARAVVEWGGHRQRLRRMALHPLVTAPGYWFATACGLVWGAALSLGRMRRQGGVIVASGCPRWAFGRGGTTIGAVYLTHDKVSPAILRHEAVHRAQWRRYGLAFIVLYVAAGSNPRSNRFEVEAGLTAGGYQ